MKKLLRAAALALLLAVTALLLALIVALQPEPAVTLMQPPAVSDVARAVALLRTHDPRRARPGAVSAVQVGERDLEVLLNHGALRRIEAYSTVSLQRGAATVRSSVPVPPNPFGRWLNVELRLLETGGLPVIAALRVGRLPLPAVLAEWALPWLARRAGVQGELGVLADVVRRVHFTPQRLVVVYAWRNDSAERMLGTLVPAGDQARLRAYSDHLLQVVARQGPGWTVSLAALVGPMFELARARSAAREADAAAENRAALVVLTLYVNGRGVGALLPAARAWPRVRPLRVTLAGRDDFPRHLLISAALAAEGTGPLSRAIGVYKEVADSRNGSGFSFNDMAANRAGTRLGEWALAQPQRLQAALGRSLQDGDLMPAWEDLPEFMTEPEFLKRYGGVGAPAYEAMLAEIDVRVGALAVFR
ncbi:MAG: hypothetical protein C0505_04870 [Leptothrix sp. (in: Bacteria)]|nr:hypothetical protein [Leptothrix sp. (in: b-proteobacteria)]